MRKCRYQRYLFSFDKYNRHKYFLAEIIRDVYNHFETAIETDSITDSEIAVDLSIECGITDGFQTNLKATQCLSICLTPDLTWLC